MLGLIDIKCNDRVAIINEYTEKFVVTTKDYFENNIISSTNKFINDILFTNKQVVKKKYNTIFFNITDMCNLNCDFCCMSPDVKGKGVELLNQEHLNEVISKLKHINVNRLVITGGEPFMISNLSQSLRKLRDELKCKIIIQTNGTLLNKDNIEEICEYIDGVDISVQHMFLNNSIKNLDDNMEHFTKSNVKVSLSFVIAKDTKPFISKAIDMAYKHNVLIDLKTVDNVGHALLNKENVHINESVIDIMSEITEYIIKKKYFTKNMLAIFSKPIDTGRACSGYGNLINLRQNGDLFMCHSLNEEQFRIGNLLKISIDQIHKNIEYLKEEEEIKNLFDVTRIESCRECKLKIFCHGPCAAIRINNEEVDCTRGKLLLIYNLFYYDSSFSIEENFKMLRKSIKEFESNMRVLNSNVKNIN